MSATVSVRINGKPRAVREGEWIVKDLKAALGIEQRRVLALIRPMGLKDLDDAQIFAVADKMNFMDHARAGGSS